MNVLARKHYHRERRRKQAQAQENAEFTERLRAAANLAGVKANPVMMTTAQQLAVLERYVISLEDQLEDFLAYYPDWQGREASSWISAARLAVLKDIARLRVYMAKGERKL